VVLVCLGSPEEEDCGADDEVDAKRTDETVEPIFFNTLTYRTVDECVHCYSLSAIVDLTADCGDRAVSAAASGILYTGICLSETHTAMLKWRVQEKIYRHMLEEGHRLYNPKLATLVQAKADLVKANPVMDDKDGKKDTEKKKKKKDKDDEEGTNNTKEKKSKKSKKAKASSSSSSSSDSTST
jgi:hypothetical protein